MAIAQTGSITFINPATITQAASGTVASITVPSDAEIMLIGVSAYDDTANHISANGTFDIGGNASVGIGGASSTATWQSALHYILAPATGTQNLDWQWGGGAGSALSEASLKVWYGFWKGIDTGSPVRDSDGAQGATDTIASPTLTAQTGDLIVACGAAVDETFGNTDVTFDFTGDGGADVLENTTNFSFADIAVGTASPTGNQTITVTAATLGAEASISAIVLKPAAAASVGRGPLAGPLGFPFAGPLG